MINDISFPLPKPKLEDWDLETAVNSLLALSLKDSLRALRTVKEAEDYFQQAYQGRYLFELIQNVRDANKAADMQGKIYIEVKDNTLSIANTGKGFDQKGLESITTIGSSPKDSKDFIGFKGIGFKSVQEITETPKIVTQKGSILFDRNISIRHFPEGTMAGDLPLFFIPHFSAQKLSEKEIRMGIVTKIVMPLRPGVNEQEIVHAFSLIKGKQLLLLGSIEAIYFNTPSTAEFFIIREEIRNGKVSLETNLDISYFKHFKPKKKIQIPIAVLKDLPKKELDIYSKNPTVDISILLRQDKNFRLLPRPNEKLYLFYPLNTRSGFHFIIHSYFLVNAERTKLRDNNLNRFLLRTIADFIGEQLLKQLMAVHKNTYIKFLIFDRNPDEPVLDELYDRLIINLKQQKFITDPYSSRRYRPDQIMLAGETERGLFENNIINGLQLLYITDDHLCEWLTKEFNVDKLSLKSIKENLEQECARQKKNNNYGFFNHLYRYLIKNERMDTRGLKILLTSKRTLLSDQDDVIYLRKAEKTFLPPSISKKINFSHRQITIPEIRQGKENTGFLEYNTELLVRKLLQLYEDPTVEKSEILQQLLKVDIKERLAAQIRARIQLPTVKGEWVRSNSRSLYFQSDELIDLYPSGHFIDIDQINGGKPLSEVQIRKLTMFGVWSFPAIYYTGTKKKVDDSDSRFSTLRAYKLHNTNYFELRGDWKLDVPEKLNYYFSQQIFENWAHYVQIMKDDTFDMDCKSHSSDYFDINSDHRVMMSSFVESLMTLRWIFTELDGVSFHPSEVIGIEPGEYNHGSSILLRKYLAVIKLNIGRYEELISTLGIMHLEQRNIQNWQRILSHVSRKYPYINLINKEFIQFYNKILSKLYDWYEYNLGNKDLIKILKDSPFLAINETKSTLSWENASLLYHMDDKQAYDFLPLNLQELFQPQFSVKDRKRFGLIAKLISKSFKASIRQEIQEAVVIRTLKAKDFFPFFAECLALIDSQIDMNLDKDIERINAASILIVNQVNVHFLKDNNFIQSVALSHKVVGGKQILIYATQPPLIGMNEFFATLLRDFFEELFDKDTNNVRYQLSDFLSRVDKIAYLSLYQVDKERVSNIREKLSDQEYSNEQFFWMAVLRSKGIDFIDGYFSNEQIYFDSLSLILGGTATSLRTYSLAIDHQSLNSLSNKDILVDLFRLLNINLEKFNKYSFTNIDYSEHFERQFQGFKSRYREQIEKLVYQSLLDRGWKDKQGFQDIMDQYDSMGGNISRPLLSLDLEYVFLEEIDKHFGIKINKQADIRKIEINLNEIYDRNLRCVRTILKKHKLLLENLNSFLSFNYHRSLVYFGEVDAFVKVYKEYLAKKPILRGELGGSGKYDSYVNDSSRQVTELSTGRTTEHSDGAGSSIGKGSGKGNGKRIDGGEASEGKEEVGIVSEKMVYEQLKALNKKDLNWLSKNAAKAGHNPEGSDSYGYDMSYTDEEGNPHYIEVKGKQGDELHFYISKSEIRKARTYGGFYHIYFVTYALNNLHRRIYHLGNLFLFEEGEDVFTSSKFTATYNILEITFAEK